MALFRDAATSSNTALLVVHHSGKKSTARGSTALTASADIILMLERNVWRKLPAGAVKDAQARCLRHLKCDSRFSKAPDLLQFAVMACASCRRSGRAHKVLTFADSITNGNSL